MTDLLLKCTENERGTCCMRVFIVCPAEYATGGTELLHQLAYMLSMRGVENYIIYTNRRETICPTPASFMKYGVQYVSAYVDSEDSILVMAETQVHYMKECKKGKAVIWWLSVDNYFNAYPHLIKENNIDIFKIKERNNVVHFVQSFYAKVFIQQAFNISESYFLTDYINDDIIKVAQEFSHSERKEDIVLYNPKKGYKDLEPIILSCRKDIKWIPLKNLTPVEMAALMCKAKLYVDFGGHPGKDRIPREAAMCGCCILTNRIGSAAYQEDVNIPLEYKVNDMTDVEEVLEKIYDIVESYEERTLDFNTYRQTISIEKKCFSEEVDDFIAVLNNKLSNSIENKIKVECEKTSELLIGASKSIQRLAEGMLISVKKGENSSVVKNMLTMDYVMQIMREAIYTELACLKEDEEKI